MPKQPRTTPYGPVERDLCMLTGDRVRSAIMSVLQITETNETKFLITTTAVQEAVAMSAGVYSALYGARNDDPFEVAKIILNLTQQAAASTGSKGNRQ